MLEGLKKKSSKSPECCVNSYEIKISIDPKKRVLKAVVSLIETFWEKIIVKYLI